MATVTVAINGQTYTLACRDGEEARLAELAEQVDAKAHELSRRLGQVGETRLMVMVALMMTDALEDARADAGTPRAGDPDTTADTVRLLEDARSRVEALAGRMEG